LRILEFLRRQGITAAHYNNPGQNDLSKRLRFIWDAEKDTPLTGKIEFSIDLILKTMPHGPSFDYKATLQSKVDGIDKSSDLAFPEVADDAGSSDQLGEQIEASLGFLAASLLRASS
jgi:hypothetical protein